MGEIERKKLQLKIKITKRLSSSQLFATNFIWSLACVWSRFLGTCMSDILTCTKLKASLIVCFAGPPNTSPTDDPVALGNISSASLTAPDQWVLMNLNLTSQPTQADCNGPSECIFQVAISSTTAQGANLQPRFHQRLRECWTNHSSWKKEANSFFRMQMLMSTFCYVLLNGPLLWWYSEPMFPLNMNQYFLMTLSRHLSQHSMQR